MAGRQAELVREDKRRKGQQRAYYDDRFGQRVVVKAEDFDEANRPARYEPPLPGDKHPIRRHYLCEGCGHEVYFNAGVQANGKGPRGNSFFVHARGGANFHIDEQADTIYVDLTNALIRHAKKRGWDVELTEATATSARVLTFSKNREDGSVHKQQFVIAPKTTHYTKHYPDAVVITSTTGQAADCRRLTLCDEEGNLLSAQAVKDVIGELGPDKFWVYGNYEIRTRENIPSDGVLPMELPEGKTKFVEVPLRLTAALDGIMDESRDFVYGVHSVHPDYFPSGARYALVKAEEKEACEKLVSEFREATYRRTVAQPIAEELGLTVYRDKSKVTTTDHKIFGGGEVLFVFEGFEHNPESKWPPGARKVVVNPSPQTVLMHMNREDWNNTLVLFVGKGAGDDRQEFLRLSRQFRRDNVGEGFNISITGENDVPRAIRTVRAFLREELARRDEKITSSRAETSPPDGEIFDTEPVHVGDLLADAGRAIVRDSLQNPLANPPSSN